MNDRLIDFDPLIEGVLIKRYKRFLADIELENGEVVTAHCANTGPMKGLLSEGAKVRISVSSSLKRLPYKGSASSPGAKKQASFLVMQSTKTLLLSGINSFNSMRCFWPLFVTVSGNRATFSLIQVVFLTSM